MSSISGSFYDSSMTWNQNMEQLNSYEEAMESNTDLSVGAGAMISSGSSLSSTATDNMKAEADSNYDKSQQ